jgi:TetR/AcrR family transcriptional repressor of nem operon
VASTTTFRAKRSWQELVCAAFDYSAAIMRERFEAALASREGAVERLFAIVDVLGCLADDPPVAGGCPILNTAVESDGANPELKERAGEPMSGWLRLLGRIVKEGVCTGELTPST